MRARHLLLVAPILLAISVTVAVAFWTATGSSSASASVGTLNAPTNAGASATAGSGTVHVTWTASAPSGGLSPQGYYVLRRASGGATAAACGSSASSTLTGTTCSDTNVADGAYTYTVVAKYASWTATSAASNSVTVANDNTAPTVTVDQKSGQSDPANTLPILWTVTFSEPVTGFDAGDLTRGGTTTGGTVDVTGSGAAYQIALSGTPTNGTTTFSIAAGRARDLAGNDNTASTSTDNSVTYDTVAPSTNIATTPASPNGTNQWFTQAGVSFTLAATDATSGVAGRFYTIDGGATQTYGGAVAISTQGDHTVTYWATDNAGNAESVNSTHLKLDNVAPTTTLTTNPASPDGTNGWFKRSSVSFALAASDATSGPAGSSYTIDGAGTQSYSGTVTISTQGDHTVTFWSTDNAGNVEGVKTTHVKLDNVAPANALALTAKAGGGSFMSAGTVYYQGSVAGSFKLQNSVTDASSGAASSTFGVLAGSSTGWTHTTPDTQTTPAGGPFASNAFGWAINTTSGPTEVVTGADAAGNTTAAPALTFTNDSTAPSGGSITYTNGFLAALSVPVTLADGTDAGSGIDPAARFVERDQAAPTATGGCGNFPGTFETGVTLSGGADASVATNTCYQYRYRVLDRVTNQATYTSANVTKVDATAPTPMSVVALNGKTLATIDHSGNNQDTLTFTYSDAFGVSPGSIVAGWDGTQNKPVSVTFTNGGAANDTITIPGIGTVDLGSTTWLSGTPAASTVSETLTSPGPNQFQIAITTDPANATSGNAASNFTWSTTGGTAKDGAANSATGSVTTNAQRF